ncbi:MAG: 30S ribosomal protein S4 [Firmicutes bacterium]|uniref:Small ribosomal subunit protein uS4 n=1 Tax=Candidatus Onthovivens merdipullorum TaxID=2840889 RepID=A0A9D9DH27_9BACL|nr:30S ribosomal protein S4 [Candidatus Onthovivens merdipullorum]
MRNLDSKFKRSRRLQFSITETGKELGKKRKGLPGQHAAEKKKLSEYGKQLQEKQKLRDMYGVSERQFRRLFVLATKSKEVTGTAFFRILESRLDNLVYRMGFASTRAQARQLVNHGHILVNGKKIDIPSYLCKVNDVISIKEKSKGLLVIKNAMEQTKTLVGYVTRDDENKSGVYTRYPERNELTQDIKEAQIIEYYNRRL